MTLSIIVTIISLLSLIAVWFRRRELKISWGLAWLWSLVWIGVAVVFWWPELTSRVADILHIGRGADVVVYAAIIILLFVVFRLFVRMESLERSITLLTRELAIRNNDQSSDTHRKL